MSAARHIFGFVLRRRGRGGLPFFIARRYLFAKKSHNVINIISLISAAGIMIGTLALVVVVSVYNGFDELVQSMYHTFDADLRITPATGKVFTPHSAIFDEVRRQPGVVSFTEVVEENVLLEYRGYQDLATIKGIDSAYLAATPLPQTIVEGGFTLWHGEVEQAVLGRGIAYKLGVGLHFIDPLLVHAPKRDGRLSLLNPEASLVSEYIYPSGIFAIEQSFDNTYFFAPIAFARRLFDYADEVTAIEIRLAPQADVAKVQRQVKTILGAAFVVKNRYEQHETMYRMMKSEKAVIYAILLFILVVISCNVLGSLAMLIIEKKDDVLTLRSMGADERLINRIFLFEGWMISLLGILIGIVLGLGLCVAQQTFGLIPMPGNFLVNAYPVSIQWFDVALIAVAVAVIGYIAAWLPVQYAKRGAE
ncbi:MAG: ABC transporter permease [Prevotellaceae bacterium]|jgi:ABC-type lipoprotein release transport system permease subunit|nr:ABC transporter permease [Prevotellaceae bacterium]